MFKRTTPRLLHRWRSPVLWLLSALLVLVLWLLSALLVLLAAALPTPLCHKIRGISLVLICAATGAALAMTWHAWRRGILKLKRETWLRALLLLVVASYTGGQELSQRQITEQVLSAPPAELSNVGRHVMVGYKDVHDIRHLVAHGAVGGLFITSRNLRGRSVDLLRHELASLQTLRRERGLPALIIAADQEGGVVSRLSPWLTALPPLAELASITPTHRRHKAVRRYAAIHGRELAALGVTLNFGPVVDLRARRAAGSADLYSQIPRRAIHHDPARVREVAHIYARELLSHGVTATFKHFPGLGRVTADTHHR
ncbi:MAG: glycoside hydrolase family 3 protein [Deltaproteobacteria bacterium]|nr:glycoside hydrolase family 3 protein [Deltaproteobacteria bacterium]